MTTATVARPSSESTSHWYFADGRSCHEVERSDGKGTRPATLRDAKKLGLLPSPTSILKVLRAPQLEAWLTEQACLAVLTAPRKPGEELDAFVERVLHTERQQDEQAQKARDLGTQIHDAIAGVLMGTAECPIDLAAFVAPAVACVSVFGKVRAVESVVIGKGYAGRLDCIFDGNATTVLDFKTTGSLTLPTVAYWEHQCQVASYAKALPNKPVQTAVLYISTVRQGELSLCVQENWEQAWSAFEHLLHYWQIANNYDPTQP